MNERRAFWENKLAADGCDNLATLYPRVAALQGGELEDLLAFCTASTVSAIFSNDSRSEFGDLLAKEAGLDMADWWEPTAANYFGFVSKPKIVEVLTEAGIADESGAFGKMKKGELANAAEERMHGKRWVPALLKSKTE